MALHSLLSSRGRQLCLRGEARRKYRDQAGRLPLSARRSWTYPIPRQDNTVAGRASASISKVQGQFVSEIRLQGLCFRFILWLVPDLRIDLTQHLGITSLASGEPRPRLEVLR